MVVSYSIQNISYSREALFEKAMLMVADVKLLEWERSIWSFILEWLDDSKDFFNSSTSGSTGIPKNISIAKQYAIESARKTISYFGLQENDTIHLCMNAQYIGAKMIIVRAFVGHLRLSYVAPTSDALAHITETVDFCAAVSLQVSTLIEKYPAGNPLIRQLIIGGGIIHPTLKTSILAHQTKYFQSFGMTETISHIAIRTLAKEDTFYECLDGVHISLRQADDCLKIDIPAMGIEGLQTNDIVRLINESTFEWLGRADNVINSGGIKIHPEKLELLMADCIAFPYYLSSLPDEKLGSKLVLYIETKSEIDEPFLLDQLKSVLPALQTPREIIIQSAFKYTATGKIIRNT